MKIAIVNNLYRPFDKGGAEKVANILYDIFSKNNIDPFVITTKPYGAKEFKTEERVYYLKSFYFNLNKIPYFFRLFWHFFDVFDIVKYFQIKRILVNEKPDLVIGLNLKGLTYLLPKLTYNLKIKYYHYPQDVQLLIPSGLIMYGEEDKMKGILNKIYININRQLFKYADSVIFSSKWLKQIHDDNIFFPKSKKLVICNPIFINNDSQVLDRGMNFLYVGQVEKHKGIKMLVELFRQFHNKDENINLKIIGSGSYAQEIKKHISPNIKLLGKLNYNNVRQEMNTSLALIVPSLCYENSPFVIYEAASTGLPIIASRIGGITELIKDLGGFLFTPNNKIELENVIKNILNNPKQTLQTGKCSMEKIKKYDIEEYKNRFLDII